MLYWFRTLLNVTQHHGTLVLYVQLKKSPLPIMVRANQINHAHAQSVVTHNHQSLVAEHPTQAPLVPGTVCASTRNYVFKSGDMQFNQPTSSHQCPAPSAGPSARQHSCQGM